MENRIQKIRLLVQILFVFIVTIASYLHVSLGPGVSPPIDALCPFGAVETFYKFASTGNFITRTYFSNFILLGGTIALLIVLGRYFCGWICIIGTFQEFFSKLGLKLIGRKINLPEKTDRILRYLKYFILAFVIILTWKTGELIIRSFDPYAAFAHITAGAEELFEEFKWGLLILIVSLIGSMFIDRIFCKYVCPMGALLGIFNKITLFRIERKDVTCVHCGQCDSVCPADLKIENSDSVKSSECFSCLQCVSACPEGKNTLFATIGGKFISPILIAVLGVVLYLSIPALTKAAGIWESAPGSTSENESFGDRPNPEHIRGVMTLKEVSEKYGISIDRIYSELNLSQDKILPEMKIKEIEKSLEKEGRDFSAENVREAVKKIYSSEKKKE